MIRPPPRSTQGVSSAASDVYKRQVSTQSTWGGPLLRPAPSKQTEKRRFRVTVITAHDLGFRYPSGSWIFKDYSFHLKRGEALAILGPNGRGKTTLLRCLLGTASPERGSLTLGGSRGYVPQHAPVSFLSYSVLDMVLMGRIRHMGFFASPGKNDFDKAREALKKLNILDFENRPFLELSGGERQLVLIARALASECSLLLLDEPTSALDFRNEKMLLGTMKRMKEEGLTLVFTTHAPHQAIHVADKALLMFSPEEYLWGPVEEALSDIHLQRLYLSLIHISEPTRPLYISYAVFCLKKKKYASQRPTLSGNGQVVLALGS
eukprot:TRINITY_DN22264_c0_g1_i1.p1 TRINITY_DN22264_c0_g1~~TRINITY_DN22264_c0_g1_i1.p1  ORF type:complete len:321 (+),score=44.56 TRINITY_DN22264_c0_g1_i1:136-1098(+)